MTVAAAHAPLAIDDLRRARAAARFGRAIHYFESTDSTNSVAHRLAIADAEEGTVVIADAQTRGRGRLGRSWISPPGRNLYASIVLRPSITATDAPQLALVFGLAAAETIREWAPGAAIKWPNDVLIDGRKVCGILTELETEGERVAFVIAGIGVNLNMSPEEFPEDLRDKAIALSAAVGAPIDRVAFAARLLARCEDRYDVFVRDGFAAIRPLWERLSALTGRAVVIDDGARRYTGVVTGIGADGTLRLRGATAEEIHVVAGDITVIDAYVSRN